MRAVILSITFSTLFLTSACEDAQKVPRLEKENQELQEKLKAQQGQDATRYYELSQKCSQDAKVWFRSNWPSDKTTLVLDYTNHYNKAQNKCFVLVVYRFASYVGSSSWSNTMSLWDVQENTKYGDFFSSHAIYKSNDFKDDERVSACEVYGSKCKTDDEFQELVRPFMND